MEASKAAGGEGAGCAICGMLIVVAFMMVTVGFTMARLGKRQKASMPSKYRDPLND